MTRNPVIRAWFGKDEISAVLFAGLGGPSLGERAVTGRSPDIAVNHWPVAIAAHAANHPTTRHYVENVYDVDPARACGGRPVALLWLSPDCTHHSRAKGGKPRDQKIRGLAWSAIPWAQTVRPRVIMLENVPEFVDWGPVDKETGQPIKSRKGQTFRAWRRKLEALGYEVQWRKLRACDYGTPTTRTRLFVIARCDGKPIRWPTPTHGPGQTPYRTAAECIDWSIPCPSIFDRTKPLAEKTEARIARGIRKFVLESGRPFLIHLTHGTRDHDIDKPAPTVTGANRGEIAIAVPYLVHRSNGERAEVVDADGKVHAAQAPRVYDPQEPLRTVVSQGEKFALCAAFLARHYGGNENDGHPVTIPLSTITGQDHHALVTCNVERADGSCAADDREARDRSQSGRNGLASPKSERDPREPEAHRPSNEARVSRGSSSRKRSAVRGVGAQADLDIGEWTDRGRPGCEPHRREQAQQPVIKPGAGDTRTEPPARLSNRSQSDDGLRSGLLVEGQGTPSIGTLVRADSNRARHIADHSVQGRASLVASFLTKYQGTSTGSRLSDPMPTVTGSGEHLGLVTLTIDGEQYAIVDIGMRMLTPRELFRANGVADDVVIDPVWNGKPITKTDQIRLCGNICPPQWAEEMIAANFGEAA